MPVQAQSADGVMHEFPDGTAPEVVDRAMKQYAQQNPSTAANDQPPRGVVENFMAPIKAIPGDVAGEFESGSQRISEGFEQGGLMGAAKETLGGLQEAASPITGTAKALVGDPVRAILPKGRASEFVANTAEDVAGMVGPGAVSKALKAINLASDEAKLLMKEGINLTPGHMGGRVVKSAEDAASSLPIAGSFIKADQARMVEDFNKAVINRSLKQIGDKLPADIAAGRSAIDYAATAIGDKYDALLPKLSWSADGQFGQDLVDIKAKIATAPEAQQKQLQSVWQNLIGNRMRANGTMSGEMFKRVDSNLAKIYSDYAGSRDPGHLEYAEAVNETRAALRGALERANPQYAGDIQTLNRAWATFERARGASIRRATSGGVFTPGDLLADIKGSSTRSAFSTGDAMLQDLAEAGQKVLPQTIPNSGTVDRATWLGLLGLGSAGELPGVSTNAALAGAAATLPYTKVGTKAINATARAVPDIEEALGRTGPAAAAAQALDQDQNAAP